MSSYGHGKGFGSSFNFINYSGGSHQTPLSIQQFQTNSWQDVAQQSFTQNVLSNCTNTNFNETPIAPSPCKCPPQSM